MRERGGGGERGRKAKRGRVKRQQGIHCVPDAVADGIDAVVIDVTRRCNGAGMGLQNIAAV